MQARYFKPKQHYIDQYDRHTVELCRDIVGRWKAWKLGKLPKNISKKEAEKAREMGCYFELLFKTGERWEKKERTIQEWTTRDQAKDELLETAEPLEGILCLTCQSPMRPTFKDLYEWGPGDKDRVLFMYDCPNKCLPRKAFFHTGEEWQKSSHICPQCKKGELVFQEKDTPTKFITTESCTSCKYTATQEIERRVTKKQPDKQFAKDRARFCLTDEQGKVYQEQKFQLEQMGRLVDEWKKEGEQGIVSDKLAKIQRLTIAQLQKRLQEAIAKQSYSNLVFEPPETGRNILLGFSAQDTQEDRHEYDSRMNLEKAIEKGLQNTNWRLMSGGISFRLGILSGRLQAYEREEDLLQLVKGKNKM